MNKLRFTEFLLFLVNSSIVYADLIDHFQSDLARWKKDPSQFYSDPNEPMKYDPNTFRPIQGSPFFSRGDIEAHGYVSKKDRFQKSAKSWRSGDPEVLSEIRKDDRAENMVDRFELRKLDEIEARGLMRAALNHAPWTDDYWPLAQGGIAKRYADPAFPNAQDWKVNVDFVQKNSCSVDQLSPAEKYDLLVGDERKTLTQWNLRQGKAFYEATGEVEQWMGFCEGWAAASFMAPRPKHRVDLVASDGRTRIRFYPSDIKALVTLLWTEAAPPYRFLGGRCDAKNPKLDPNGRVIDPRCFDTNPATWHLALVNQIGVSKRSFVFDATYDYEVWNQPVVSYEYSYFNPQTGKPVKGLSEARVKKEEFTKDPFRVHRSPQTDSIVGIAVQIVYVAERYPYQYDLDDPRFDFRKAARYYYDLELDPEMNLLGGEWYQKNHPDFVWVHAIGAQPVSVGDRALKSIPWDGKGPVPVQWRFAARRSSPLGQPLAAIVSSLLTFAQLEPPSLSGTL